MSTSLRIASMILVAIAIVSASAASDSGRSIEITKLQERVARLESQVKTLQAQLTAINRRSPQASQSKPKPKAVESLMMPAKRNTAAGGRLVKDRKAKGRIACLGYFSHEPRMLSAGKYEARFYLRRVTPKASQQKRATEISLIVFIKSGERWPYAVRRFALVLVGQKHYKRYAIAFELKSKTLIRCALNQHGIPSVQLSRVEVWKLAAPAAP